MNIKQTIRNAVLGVFLLAGTFIVAAPATYAADNGCGVDTAIISCTNVKGKSGVQGSGLWSLLLTAINILTAGVGILAVAGIVYGAILYASSGGSPEQIKKARTIFTNVVIGVVAFGGMFALLNFLIPGGIFAQ